MAEGEQDHTGQDHTGPGHTAATESSLPARRRRRWWGWLPEVVVLLVVALAFTDLRFDQPGGWLGWAPADPDSDPAAVAPPEGLDLAAAVPAPTVAAARQPVPAYPAAVAATVSPYVGDPRLGGHVDVVVTDLSTGRAVYRHGRGPVTPASTLKILTTAAALETLGPEHRFRTSVQRRGSVVTLVGGGDPYLAASNKSARGKYPARSNLQRLAEQTANALAAADTATKRVRLRYDDSLFSGPAVNPDWPDTYRPENVVPPITALWADQGKDADGRFVDDPSAQAARLFGKALAAHGIAVVGKPTAGSAPSGSVEIAVARSAPLGEIVQETLAISDNQAAEVLARHVGFNVLRDSSFAGGARAVREVLDGLGIPLAGVQTYDGSGLSRKDRLTPDALLSTLALAASPEHPELRDVITGLPVAGFTGSLRWRFDDAPTVAKGTVRAKTGTLTGVHGLAGMAIDRDGAELGFVAIADDVSDALAARKVLDELAAALGACHCGRPSLG